MPARWDLSIRGNADLECPTAVHLVKCLLIIVELELVGHHSSRFNFAAVEIRNCAREAVRLRE